MTAEEIAALNAENARLAAIRAANATKPKKRVEVFEMAESSITIEFPVTPMETQVDDSVIAAGSATENESFRIQQSALSVKTDIVNCK
jgi:hypothetical protein